MTRAIIADELGPLANYSLREFDPGPPAAGQVRIAVRAAGVSFVDILNATGQYQARAQVPFIPGSEFSGVIDAVGDGVEDMQAGQRVMASCWGGAFAQVAVVPASVINLIPDAMSFEQAAVFRISALTVWHALVDRAALAGGESLLVLGAGGATGYAAVQLGKLLGARVIASASNAEKRAMALAAGAAAAIDAGAADWRNQVKEANGGKSIDVVFDPVGGDSTEAAFRCLAVNGRHLVVGFPRGIPSLPTNLTLLKGASLVGVNLQQLSQTDPGKAARNTEKVLEIGAQGHLVPVIAQRYSLEDFASAMSQVAAGKTAGRVVLTMPG